LFAREGAPEHNGRFSRSQFMKTTMVRYKLKPGTADENEKLVQQVFAQLVRDKPPGVRYQVFKMADGLSFVHLATSEADVNPVTLLEAFKRYAAAIKERCDELPVPVQLQMVGEYDSLD
jgi:hypothetical protein